MIVINNTFFIFRRQAMAWTEQHDILPCREILHTQPWLHRHGSVERGQLWDEIAAVLNSLEKLGFKVTSRSVRDRYGLLVKKYKTKWNEEGKSSGTNPDYTELDGALMDLIQRFDEADSERKRETNEKQSKIENEKAQEMRQTSLETFCQTKKRKESDTETPQKRRRSSFSQDYLSYFSEKSEREFQLRQEELK